MVSDVLSEAAHDIREYLRTMPQVYASIRPELERLLSEMDSIRIFLDTPPIDIPHRDRN